MRSLVLVAVIAAAMQPAVAPGVGVSAAAAADASAAEPSSDHRVAGAAAQPADDCAPVAAGEPKPNPPNDTLGWENGCWPDDRLAVTYDDGLNDTERRAVLSRAMARVEQLRQREFDRNVHVSIREPVRPDVGATEERTLPYEAMFMVPEEADPGDVFGNRRVASGYAPNGTHVVVVSNDSRSPSVDEWLLAHEVTHALQQQRGFEGRSISTRMTIAERTVTNAVVEGEAQYVEHRYLQHCNDDWQCGPTARPDYGGHPGRVAFSTTTYVQGMTFVHRIHQRGGWDAVEALYESRPASTEQLLHPGRYPDETPAAPRVLDRTGDGWRRIDLMSGKRYESVGEAGVFLTFAYTAWDDRPGEVIDREPFEPHDGPPVSLDPLDYTHQWSDGLDGDRLVFYDDPGTDRNETGYVWKLRWDTETDAREFVRGYRELLQYRGAERVEAYPATWRIPEQRRYDDAYHVNRTGRTVLIVNAPTVDELPSVRQGAASNESTLAVRTPTPTATPPTATPTAPTSPPPTATGAATPTATVTTDPGTGPTETSPTPTDGTSPGFTGVVAPISILLAALLAGRR